MTESSENKKSFWKSVMESDAAKRLGGLVFSGFGAAVLAIAVIAGVYFWPASWSGGNGDGLILLDTPQVFTRGRLVNDRATEQAWLEGRLRETNTLLGKGEFATPQETRDSQRSFSFSLASGSASPTSTQIEEELKKRLAAATVKATPQEQFEDAALYRLAIRNTLMSTVLDDRHDIEGNTIYRLNFNVSVVPPPGSDRLAIVVVELNEANPEIDWGAVRLQHDATTGNGDAVDTPKKTNPGEKSLQDAKALHSAYVDLLFDWQSRLQETLTTIVTDRRLTLEDYNGVLEPVENSAFHAWLMDRTRAKLVALAALENRGAVDRLMENILLSYEQSLSDGYTRTVDNLAIKINKDIGGVGSDPKGFASFVQQQCATKGQVELTPEQAKGSKLRPYPCAQKRVSPLILRMDMLDIVQLLGSTGLVSKSCIGARQLPEVVAAIALDGYHRYDDCRISVEQVRQQRNLTRPDERRRDLLALFQAGYILEKQTKSSYSLKWDTQRKKPKPLTLNDFFKIPEQAQCAPGSCQPIFGFTDDVNSVAAQLMNLVRPTAKAFTYSVTPNKLVRRADVAERYNNTFAASAAQGSAPSVSGSANTQGGTRALEADPTVIGFGDWNSTRLEKKGTKTDKSPKAASTKFGWAMFPRAARNGSGAKHPPESHSVSATVSLPGWWKTAHLAVRTCWIRPSDLGSKINFDYDYICPQSKTRVFDLRLPGDALELMQHLRFQVIRTPFLERPAEDPDLESGREAKVMIRGGRLWRSPVVKLGNQQADRIEVLPDMTGIIATFECVEPLPTPVVPLNPPDPEGRQPANLYLVTSEGKVPYPIRVMVRPFTPRQSEKQEHSCYWLTEERKRLAAQTPPKQ